MPKFYKNSTLNYVENHWGKDYSEIRLEEENFHDREDFFVHMMKNQDWILDDQTWNDMEMNRVYAHMDRCYSTPGQQILYGELRTLVFDEEELKARDDVMEFFVRSKDLREKIAAVLFYVGKNEYDGAASLLFKGIPKLPAMAGRAEFLTLAMILSLVSIPFIKLTGVIFALIMFVVNTLYHHKFNQKMQATIPGVQSIARMLSAAKELGAYDCPALEERYLSFFRKCAKKCEAISKKIGFLGEDSSDSLGLLEYFRIMFLSQERAYIRVIHYIEEDAPVLRVLYRKIGELDALMAAASYRKGLRRFSKPVFSEKERYFHIENAIHPLLTTAVPNSITIDNGNVVITGSNMSGKSTFLRTMATNVVLAQTFYTVSADFYEASFMNLLTSISPSDDLMGGKSYYMAEAEALLRMVEILGPERPAFLIIDEIFRGTNSVERVAAASSLLEYLGKRNTMVVVATHDIEIIAHVAEQYESYYFGENVTRDSLDFDYQLKKGVLTTPNGIRILEYLGYPEEITEQAYKNAEGVTDGTELFE